MSSISTQALGPIAGPSCWTPPPPLRILSPSPKAIVKPSPLPPAREIAPLEDPQAGSPFTIGEFFVLSKEVYYIVYQKFIFAHKVMGINAQLEKEIEMNTRQAMEQRETDRKEMNAHYKAQLSKMEMQLHERQTQFEIFKQTAAQHEGQHITVNAGLVSDLIAEQIAHSAAKKQVEELQKTNQDLIAQVAKQQHTIDFMKQTMAMMEKEMTRLQKTQASIKPRVYNSRFKPVIKPSLQANAVRAQANTAGAVAKATDAVLSSIDK